MNIRSILAIIAPITRYSVKAIGKTMLQIFKYLTCLCVLGTFGLSLMPQASSAQEFSLFPSKTITVDEDIEQTHPMVRLTPEQSKIIKLSKDAVSVIVGNPAHLSVLLDTPRVLVLVPRIPGASHFTVLDSRGNVMMQRHVIVASPKEKYVRIRRSCRADAEGCLRTSVYYCPDICHDIAVIQPQQETESSEIPDEAPNIPVEIPEQTE